MVFSSKIAEHVRPWAHRESYLSKRFIVVVWWDTMGHQKHLIFLRSSSFVPKRNMMLRGFVVNVYNTRKTNPRLSSKVILWIQGRINFKKGRMITWETWMTLTWVTCTHQDHSQGVKQRISKSYKQCSWKGKYCKKLKVTKEVHTMCFYITSNWHGRRKEAMCANVHFINQEFTKDGNQTRPLPY